MSWDVKEDWRNNQTGVTIQPNGNKGTSTTVRVFTAVADDINYRTIDALAAPGIPLRNEPHPNNPFLLAKRFDCVNEGPMYFIITVTYEAATTDPNDPAENPLLSLPVITFSSVTQEVELDEALEVYPARPLVGDGYPIETINGEPINGVTAPFTDLVMTVQRNLPSFNPESISLYNQKVNNSTFYGFPAGTVRITNISASSVSDDTGVTYWDVSASFQIRRGRGPVPDERAWWFRTAHQGYKVRLTNGGPLSLAKTSDNQTVTQPVMIDLTTGVQLTEGTGAFIEFRIFEEIDFNDLNLL